MSKMEQLGIGEWSVADKLTLLDELWESLPEQIEPTNLPNWHREEVEKRRTEMDQKPGAGRPWRDVLTELEDAG